MIRTPQECFHVQLFAIPESVLFSSLFFSFYCMHTGDLCIVVLLTFAFCIFIFCIFLWDPTWFCPGPIALSLPLLCADFLFLSLESNLSTCSLISRTCIYICLYLHFSWKKPVNLLSHQQNLYLYLYSYFSWKQPVNLLSHLQKLLCLE